MVNIDDSDHFAATDQRHGQEGFVFVLGESSERFEARIRRRLGRQRNDRPMLRYPTGDPFADLQTHPSDFLAVPQLRGA